MIELPKSEVLSEIHSYVAPHILNVDLIKRFLTLQAFVNPEHGEKLHLLIIGGTATGKSELCSFLSKVLLGRSAFVQKDSTFAGLREKFKRINGSVLYIDEFDKTKKDARTIFLEAMQNGTVTVTNFNQQFTYPAKISVTALCNPKEQELSKDIPLSAQLSFSKEYYLLSRFHFIIPIYAIESLYYPDIAERYVIREKQEQDIINRLRELMIGIKQDIPTVSIDQELARKIGEHVKYIKDINIADSLLITPRLIEGLISATKARARMLGKEEAKEDHFVYIKELYEKLIR
jgi:DNA replicative helicase MCM subunit Mcm2 (Cdc46/Mcm family)